MTRRRRCYWRPKESDTAAHLTMAAQGIQGIRRPSDVPNVRLYVVRARARGNMPSLLGSSTRPPFEPCDRAKGEYGVRMRPDRSLLLLLVGAASQVGVAGRIGSPHRPHLHRRRPRWPHSSSSSRLRSGLIRTPYSCLLYTSPSPRDKRQSRMPSSA